MIFKIPVSIVEDDILHADGWLQDALQTGFQRLYFGCKSAGIPTVNICTFLIQFRQFFCDLQGNYLRIMRIKPDMRVCTSVIMSGMRASLLMVIMLLGMVVIVMFFGMPMIVMVFDLPHTTFPAVKNRHAGQFHRLNHPDTGTGIFQRMFEEPFQPGPRIDHHVSILQQPGL